jgi:hypothetical protein
MSGQGFEFTPGGVIPLAAPVPGAGGTINAADAVAQMRAAQQAHVSTVAVHSAPAAKPVIGAQPIRRRSLIKEIRDRLRAVERELKSHARLQREASELRRLLAAAKQPTATVADIHQARKTG